MMKFPAGTRRMETPFESLISADSETSGVLLGISLAITDVELGFNTSVAETLGDGTVTVSAGGGAELLERFDQRIGITAASRVATAPMIAITISVLSFGARAGDFDLIGFPTSAGG